jgi:Ser/Thr protein kinase RdoA (MazF antagonist)
MTEDRFPLHLWGWQEWSVRPWHRDAADLGYNSHTHLVIHESERYVVKVVPKEVGPKYTDGLAVAALVEAAGIPTGAPVPTAAGDLTAYDGERCWGVLRFLDGTRVDTADARHLGLVGQTLGRIHAVLQHVEPPPHLLRWDQLGGAFGDAPFLADKAWILEAFGAAFAALPSDLTMGLIHCDPHADSFRIGATAVGVIDWGEVMYAPCLLDVATTLSYFDESVDARPFLASYLETAPMRRTELAALAAMLKLRAAAEAYIYASRDWMGNNVGFDGGQHDNVSLLERARKNIDSAEQHAERFRIG